MQVKAEKYIQRLNKESRNLMTSYIKPQQSSLKRLVSNLKNQILSIEEDSKIKEETSLKEIEKMQIGLEKEVLGI